MLTGSSSRSADQDEDPPARPVSEMGICLWTKEELLTYLSQPLRLEVLHSLNRSILDEMPILQTLSDVQK